MGDAAFCAPRVTLRLLSSVLVVTLGCTHPSGWNASHGEEVLERGGELRDARPERALTVTASQISVWGITEVPASARLQMAMAGVDAITRSELLKAIEVRVSEVVTSVESSPASRRSVVVETSEVVAGVLARGAPLPHGWARIQRGDEVILRIWARLDVPRATLEGALRSTLGRASIDAESIVDRLRLVSSVGIP